MNADLADALLRLHGKVSDWLKKSGAEEEAAWREQVKLLESETVCETDEEKRGEKERELRHLLEFLDKLDNRLTDAYANLIFACGLARIGALTESASLEASTAPMFRTEDAVHRLAFRAFTYRINQARKGGACRGPLPPEFVTTPGDKGELEDRMARYKFDRLRKHVLMLEPSEEVNLYRRWITQRSQFDCAIGLLYEIADPKELEARTRDLLEKCKRVDNELKVLKAALDLFPRLPPSFGRSVLETAQAFLGALPPVADMRKRERERRESCERISSLERLSDTYFKAQAAHDNEFRDLSSLHERVSVLEVAARRAGDGSDAALLRAVIRSLTQLVEAQHGEDTFHAIPVLAGRCLQSFQRLHLWRELEPLLHRVTEWIHGQPGVALRRAQDDANRTNSLLLLLNVAAGWLSLGRSDLAKPMREEARIYLLSAMPDRHPNQTSKLACRYIATLALSPIESAVKGLEELFPGVGLLGDTMTTNSHYSLVRLQIIDAVVRAVVHLAHPEDDVDDYLAVSLN